MTTLRAERPNSTPSIPGKVTRFFFLLHRVQTVTFRHNLKFNAHQGPFPRKAKRLEHEADHSSPYSAEVKMRGAIPPFIREPCWLGS